MGNKFFLIKDVGEYFPGITPYRTRQWCKQKKIRFNKALRQYWMEEDLEKMALDNIKDDTYKNNNQYDVLRQING